MNVPPSLWEMDIWGVNGMPGNLLVTVKDKSAATLVPTIKQCITLKKHSRVMTGHNGASPSCRIPLY